MDTFTDLWPWLVGGAAAALLALALLGRYVLSRARVELPDGVGVLDALRETPLSVVLFLDVNDLVLDSFGAPVAWWVLSRLGLGSLRKVAVIEALVPGTQLLPTFTLAWLFARVRRRGGTADARALPARDQ